MCAKATRYDPCRTAAALIVLCPLQPVDESLQARMLFIMDMHKHQAETCGIRPSHFSHFDCQRFVRRGELNLQRQIGAHRKRFLARDMATLLGETGHHPASVDGVTGERKRHLYFITWCIATFHRSLSSE